MKFQLVLLSFMVLGSFQLLDVDGLRKSGSVSEEKNVSANPIMRTCSCPITWYFQIIIWRVRLSVCAVCVMVG